MARLPRLELPGLPQHVVQRGNDRLPCFIEGGDYAAYLHELRDAANKHGCAIHAFVLMTNHVHLLVTPPAVGALGKMMQAVGRRYVGAFNARYRRSGTLWEGRYKAGLVDTDAHLLRCYRYIELNPVRAGMVAAPGDYPWSSYHRNACGNGLRWLRPHDGYLSLGNTDGERRAAYGALFDEALDGETLAAIRTHVNQGKAWGNARFQAHVEAMLGRKAAVRRRGRPARDKPAGES